MSLDEIVKASRAEKEKSGGKAKREGKGGGGRAAPYSKKGKDGPGGVSQRKKKEPQAKKEKEPKKERPPPKPAKSIYVGNLPFTIEAATVETHLGKVASCTVELKMRSAEGKADGKEEGAIEARGLCDCDLRGRRVRDEGDRGAPRLGARGARTHPPLRSRGQR